MGYQIAIDGPAAAGKTTTAKLMAKRLGFVYVDTGALYRAVALRALQMGYDTKTPHLEDCVIPILTGIGIELKHGEGEQFVYLDGKDITDDIRTETVSQMASVVSAVPAVRGFLLKLQQRLAAQNDVVMEGRDIGTVVLPKADIKFFLTADVDTRAARRHKQLISKGIDADLDKVMAELKERDERDSSRKAAPLKPAENAIRLDNSKLSIENTVATLMLAIDISAPCKPCLERKSRNEKRGRVANVSKVVSDKDMTCGIWNVEFESGETMRVAGIVNELDIWEFFYPAEAMAPIGANVGGCIMSAVLKEKAARNGR